MNDFHLYESTFKLLPALSRQGLYDVIHALDADTPPDEFKGTGALRGIYQKIHSDIHHYRNHIKRMRDKGIRSGESRRAQKDTPPNEPQPK